MATVVIRLWEPVGVDAPEGVLRGVVQIIGAPGWQPFVGERELLDILTRTMARRGDVR